MVSTALDPPSSAVLARVGTSALIRVPRASLSTIARWVASVAFACATLFLVLGTYFFTKFYRGPAILARIGL